MMKKLICVLITVFSLNTFATIDFTALEGDLKTKGLHGWIHGSTEYLGLYVFTYREPGNFFSFAEFPLVADKADISALIKTFERHDEVLIKGSFLQNGAPIRHIHVDDITMVKKFISPVPVPEAYSYEAKLPDDLKGKTEFDGKVHAIAEEGKIIVLEYKDAVIPVVNGKPELAKDLYRNDRVHVVYQIQNFPGRPTHISLDLTNPNPLTVTDKMVSWHGKPAALTGDLVLFPKSPEISFNVFALHTVDDKGISREFTLVNFDDQAAFEAIRSKLQTAWDQNPTGVINGRNKLINPNIQIKATGSFNVVDPGQANPQILLAGPQSIELTIR